MDLTLRERLRASFQSLYGGTQASVALLDSRGSVLDVTPYSARYFSAGDGMATPLQKRIADACAGISPGAQRRLNIETTLADHSTSVIDAEIAAPGSASEDPEVVIVWLKDVTDHAQVEREASLLGTLAVALGRTDSAELGITVALEQICRTNGWAVGEAWFPKAGVKGTDTLYRKAAWTRPGDGRLGTFLHQAGNFEFERGQGLPGRAWADGATVRSRDLKGSVVFTRGPLAAAAGLRAAVAVPMVAAGEVVAVLTFFTHGSDDISSRAVQLVQSIAAPLALLIKQKGAEEARRVAEARFVGIVSIADDAIVSIDGQRRVILFNWGAERIFGYSSEEVIGKPVEMFLPVDIRAKHGDHVAEFAGSHDVARRMGERSKIIGRRKNGGLFPAEGSISRFASDSDWIYTVILRDITERVRNEEGLELLVEASAVLIGITEDPSTLQRVAACTVPVLCDVCIIDRIVDDSRSDIAAVAATRTNTESDLRGVASHVEPGAQEIRETVVDNVQTITSHAAPMIDSSRFEVLRAHGVHAVLVLPLATHERTVGTITFGLTREGAQFDTATRGFAGALASRIAIAMDSDVLYGKLRAAIEGRDRVLAIVSHDLRNPLSAISMCLSGLQDEPPPDRTMSLGLISTADEAVGIMHRMIQDLLDTAAIDSGRLTLDRVALPLGELVRQTVMPLQALALESGLTLTTACEATDARVDVDPDRFAQVVSNLVGNACKFTELNGSVRLSADVRDSAAHVVVSDTGIGIAPEALPHIFDRYWHARNLGRKRRSSGLGLSIAKGIVEAHGGRIWAESREGHGSQFHFTIPLAPADNAPDDPFAGVAEGVGVS
jgi:PAS domain S-box-containing protein